MMIMVRGIVNRVASAAYSALDQQQQKHNNKMYNKGHVLPADGQLRTCEQSHALIQHIVTFVL